VKPCDHKAAPFLGNNHESGFVLVMVLWVLAAIILFAGSFAVWVDSAGKSTILEKERIDATIDVAGTRATLLYLLGTNSLTHSGLTLSASFPAAGAEKSGADVLFDDPLPGSGNTIALDDTAYAGLGKACFSIQDEGGLIGLGNPSPVMVGNLLAIIGIPSPETGPLVDKLLDYIDQDDLKRLNGAEAPAYENLGLDPPSNYLLHTTREAFGVLGWDKHAVLWKADRFSRLTSVATGGIPNFNTAPVEVLMTLPGIDAKTADRIVSARENSGFRNLRALELAAAKKLPLDPMEMRLFPLAHLRITLWSRNARRYSELHIALTSGTRSNAPWMIDHEIAHPMISTIKAVHDTPPGFSIFDRQASAAQQ
jgi:general secretion pathway protein K